MKKDYKLFILLILYSVLAITFSIYKKYALDQKFLFTVNTACDPNTEKCFISDDPSADATFDNSPYKKVEITETYSTACLDEHSCENFSCTGIPKSDCNIIYCSNETLTGSEKCLTK